MTTADMAQNVQLDGSVNIFGSHEIETIICDGEISCDQSVEFSTSAVEISESDSLDDAHSQIASALAKPQIARVDLVEILEGVVDILKHAEAAPTNQLLSFAPPKAEPFTVKDKTQEVEQLHGILIDAQETIIRLLTDRVEDRAKIASLEAQLRLIPDIQLQAERALVVASNTDDFKAELNKVRQEIDRLKLGKVRLTMQGVKTTWWSRFFGGL